MSVYLSFFKKNMPFLMPCVVFWMAGIFLLTAYSDVTLSVMVSKSHTFWQMPLWQCVTYGGGALFYVAVTAVTCFINRRCAVYVASLGVVISILIPVLKNIFAAPRPVTVLTRMGLWEEVSEKISHAVMTANSFPSGHAVTAFALFCMLSFFIKGRWGKFMLFMCALAVAYSRVYLLHHFFADVYAGSMIGVATACMVYGFMNRFYRNK